jgi:hypothetical protein
VTDHSGRDRCRESPASPAVDNQARTPDHLSTSPEVPISSFFAVPGAFRRPQVGRRSVVETETGMSKVWVITGASRVLALALR